MLNEIRQPAFCQTNVSGSFIGLEYLKEVKTTNPFIVDGVVIGIPFDLKELISKYGKEIIPNELGIYHLFYKDQLVYIGMSRKLRGRLLCHLKDNDMPFNNVLWFCASLLENKASVEDILILEHNLIKKFKPVLNSVHANCR
jgi:hypothetical protein